MQPHSLAQLLINAAAKWPDKEAIVFSKQQLTDNRRTFQQLLDKTREKAKALIGLGVGPGDHVGVLMPDCIDIVESIYAISLIGARAVPINIRYRATELAFVIKDADLKVLMSTGIAREHLDTSSLLINTFPELASKDLSRGLNLEKAPLLQSIVILGTDSVGGFIGDEEFYTGADTVSEQDLHIQHKLADNKDRALIMYTSGTTANPKGCVLNEGMLARNSLAMTEQRYYLNEEDRFFDPLPLFHMAAILPMLAVIQTGGTFVSMLYFEVNEALRILEEEAITVAFLTFPPITSAIINHPDFSKKDLSRIRRVNNVAPPDTLALFQQAFPQAIQTAAFGMTEAGGVITFNEPADDLPSRLTTCGQPYEGIEVKIINVDSGEEMKQDEKGEILIRGYCLFDGYYNNPEATAAAVDNEGWFHTGDICSLDEEGRIRYHGRIKDMLKVGGENVSALEIESFLSNHPAVKMVQVVGMEDARLTEVPAAFVELKEEASCSEEELLEFCHDQIASFKIPRVIKFVTEWPMSATKVQKFRLKEILGSGLEC